MKAVTIIKYIVSCAKAIIEGLEVVGDNWPTDSPFNAKEKEPQGRQNKSPNNTRKPIQGVGAVYNSASEARK